MQAGLDSQHFRTTQPGGQWAAPRAALMMRLNPSESESESESES